MKDEDFEFLCATMDLWMTMVGVEEVNQALTQMLEVSKRLEKYRTSTPTTSRT